MSADDDVLFVTQHYRPELIGPAPFCVDIAEWLLDHKAFVTVLTGPPHYPNAADFPRLSKRDEFADGVLVRRVRSLTPRRRSVRGRILGELSFLASGAMALLRGRIRRANLVVSLAPSILTIALGALSCRRGGTHVAMVHDVQSGLAGGLGMIHGRLLINLMQTVERRILNRASLVIVLTDAMKRTLLQLGVTVPIEVVSIWVDTGLVAPKRHTVANNNSRRLKLCYSGSFGRKQGFGQVLALAAELKRRRPDIDVILRGGGAQTQAIATAIAAQHLDNIRLEALLPPEAFVRSLADVDMYIVPLEAAAAPFMLPSKIFNIMAAAVPFVTTAEPGTALWRLQQESGAFVCVAPNRPDELAAAIVELADNEGLRRELGERGRRYVVQNCSKETVLSAMMAAIDRAHAA